MTNVHQCEGGIDEDGSRILNVNMNEYLPLRDVVFNTLRQAILRGRAKAGRAADGRSSLPTSWE